MQLEIKRVTTSTIEFDTYKELWSKLNIKSESIAQNIWEFCESGQEQKLSEDSEIFLEEQIDQHRLDTSSFVECEVDYLLILIQRDRAPSFSSRSLSYRPISSWNNETYYLLL